MGLWDKIRNLFGGKVKPPAAKPVRGSLTESMIEDIVGKDKYKKPRIKPEAGLRGHAFGSLKPGKMDVSPENQAKWRGVTINEVEAFLYEQSPMFVHSTNVVLVQYFHETQKMMVEFKGKKRSPASAYMYSNVSEDEAYDFVRAPSKGGWIWSHIRVRGSKTAHRKPYVKIK